MVPIAAIQAVPIAVIAWYRLQRYVWYRYSAIVTLFVCSAVDAQILRADELEKYAKEKYGEKWVDAATYLGTQLTLDKNNAITYTQVIPAEGKTKDQLYVLLNY